MMRPSACTVVTFWPLMNISRWVMKGDVPRSITISFSAWRFVLGGASDEEPPGEGDILLSRWSKECARERVGESWEPSVVKVVAHPSAVSLLQLSLNLRFIFALPSMTLRITSLWSSNSYTARKPREPRLNGRTGGTDVWNWEHMWSTVPSPPRIIIKSIGSTLGRM